MNGDTETPTIPDKELTVYSLYANDDVNRLILAYQNANPDVRAIHEIGMEDGSIAMTTLRAAYFFWFAADCYYSKSRLYDIVNR